MHKEKLIINRNFKDINPLISGNERCAPGHSYGPAIREYYLMHYVVRGRGVFQTKGRSYMLGAGDIFMTAPGQMMYYKADETDPWEYIWVGFESRLPIGEIFEQHIVNAPQCAHIFADLTKCSDFGDGAELYVCGKVYELMAFLMDDVVQKPAKHYCFLAKNFIETRYDKELTVKSIADQLGLDRSYFSKLFKKEFGLSPQQYLVRFRLERAAELMCRRGLSPGQAAVLCGYGDVVNFSKMFKKQFGVSPRAYYRGA